MLGERAKMRLLRCQRVRRAMKGRRGARLQPRKWLPRHHLCLPSGLAVPCSCLREAVKLHLSRHTGYGRTQIRWHSPLVTLWCPPVVYMMEESSGAGVRPHKWLLCRPVRLHFRLAVPRRCRREGVVVHLCRCGWLFLALLRRSAVQLLLRHPIRLRLLSCVAIRCQSRREAGQLHRCQYSGTSLALIRRGAVQILSWRPPVGYLMKNLLSARV